MQLWIILTIGCLPIESQTHLIDNPTAEPCMIPTTITEYAIGPNKSEEEIRMLLDEMGVALDHDLPGSFMIYRTEYRKREVANGEANENE